MTTSSQPDNDAWDERKMWVQMAGEVFGVRAVRLLSPTHQQKNEWAVTQPRDVLPVVRRLGSTDPVSGIFLTEADALKAAEMFLIDDRRENNRRLGRVMQRQGQLLDEEQRRVVEEKSKAQKSKTGKAGKTGKTGKAGVERS